MTKISIISLGIKELEVLKRMGCEIKTNNSSITINAKKKLKPVKLTIDQKLMILTSFGKIWFCNNRKLFKKALQK